MNCFKAFILYGAIIGSFFSNGILGNEEAIYNDLLQQASQARFGKFKKIWDSTAVISDTQKKDLLAIVEAICSAESKNWEACEIQLNPRAKKENRMTSLSHLSDHFGKTLKSTINCLYLIAAMRLGLVAGVGIGVTYWIHMKMKLRGIQNGTATIPNTTTAAASADRLSNQISTFGDFKGTSTRDKIWLCCGVVAMLIDGLVKMREIQLTKKQLLAYKRFKRAHKIKLLLSAS